MAENKPPRYLMPRLLRESITLDIINKLSIYESRKRGLVNRSNIMKLREKCSVFWSCCPHKLSGNGVPKLDIPKPLLQNLIEE